MKNELNIKEFTKEDFDHHFYLSNSGIKPNCAFCENECNEVYECINGELHFYICGDCYEKLPV